MKTTDIRRAAVGVLAGLVPVICLALDNVFTGTGLWSNDALWSLSHIPTPEELAWINGTAALDSSQTTAGLNVQGALDITGAATTYLSSGQVLVGCFATNGTLTQTGGSFESGGDFYVGEAKTGSATFTDTDVTLAKCVIGHNAGGVGNYVQKGGTVRFQGSHAVLASGTSTTKGTMSITDTAMSCVPAFVVGYTDGKFYATNSTISCTNIFAVANLLGSKGTAHLVGSAILDCTSVTVAGGTNSVAKLYAYQSSLTSDYVRVGYSIQSTGTLTVDNSLVKTAMEFSLGYAGYGTVSNVSSLIEAPTVFVGQLAGSSGNLFMQDGVLTAPIIYAGYSGAGFVEADHSSLSASTAIYAGMNAGSYGQISLVSSDTVAPNFSIGRTADATGSVTLASGTITASSALYAGYEGVGVFSNLAGTVQASTLGVAFNTNLFTGSTGYMYCGPGSTSKVSNILQVGRGGNGTVDCYGSIDVSPTINGLYIGNLAASEGTFNLYPGATLYVRNQIVLGYTTGSGTFNQYGGEAVASAYLYLGYNNSSAKGFFNLYGGTLTVSNTVYVGRYGTGELRVSGGHAIFEEKTLGLTVGTFAGATGRVYLVNGILATGRTRGVNGYSEFFFDGGTLAALASSTSFMTGLSLTEVRAGGAKIDTAGYNITVGQSLAHDTRGGEPAKDGGLTKLGAGTLTMTGTLGFTGDLGADGGTLNLSGATYSLASGSGLWGSGTLAPPSGGLSVSSDGFVAPGDTNGVGTLTVNGNLTVNGETRITISPDGATCGRLAVTGTLLFQAGSSLVIQNPDDMQKGVNYSFVTATTVSGTPAIENLPPLWSLQTRDNKIRAVYLSGTVISIR